MPKSFPTTKLYLLFSTFCLIFSCAPEPEKKEVALYRQYCASCHMAPKIESLPKDIWKNSVLPDMASRMDIEEMYDNPEGVKTTFRPKIKLADWVALQNYIIALAPEKLPVTPVPDQEVLSNFVAKPLQLDDQNGAFYTYLEYQPFKNTLVAGDISGNLKRHDFESESTSSFFQGKTPIIQKRSRNLLKNMTGIISSSNYQIAQD